MPLPLDDAPWPPPDLNPVWNSLQVWHAWYAGLPKDLQSVYGGVATAGSSPLARQFFDMDKPGSNQVSVVARTFWGEPIPPGERRVKLHIPLPGDISELSASLLYSELPQIRAADTSGLGTATTDRIARYLDDRGHATLLQGADTGSGLGGVYLRVVWDATLRDHPWLTVVHPDMAVPEWRWGCLTAVTFWQTVQQDPSGTEEWRLLEYHTPGLIEYGLYKGSLTEIGERLPLAAHPKGVELMGQLTDKTPGREQQVTGVDKLLAVYIPNMLPNRVWRTVPGSEPLGRSDYTGIEQLFDSLDETWTSWMRDLRLARSRIMIPQSMLETDGPGQGAIFRDKEVFVQINSLADGTSGEAITMNQFQIRVKEHEDTCTAIVNQVLRSAGYSSQSMGADKGMVAVTATEIAARKEQSLATRDTKILYQRPALDQVLKVLLAVDAKWFKAAVDPTADLTIAWPDAVQADPQSQATTLSFLKAASAASTDTMVRMLHPEWEDIEVAEEVARIREESAPPVTLTAPAAQPTGQVQQQGQEPGQAEEGTAASAWADQADSEGAAQPGAAAA
jgi:hypothetical protein